MYLEDRSFHSISMRLINKYVSVSCIKIYLLQELNEERPYSINFQ